jgi:hypothetical protein
MMHVSAWLEKAAIYVFESERNPSMWFLLVTDSGVDCRKKSYRMHYMELTHDGDYKCQNCDHRASRHDMDVARAH